MSGLELTVKQFRELYEKLLGKLVQAEEDVHEAEKALVKDRGNETLFQRYIYVASVALSWNTLNRRMLGREYVPQYIQYDHWTWYKDQVDALRKPENNSQQD